MLDSGRRPDSEGLRVMLRYVLLVAAATLLLAACGGDDDDEMGPAEVMDAYTDAINDHDVEAALALVAEDAVYSRPGGQFTGKEEIRGFIQGLIDRNVQVELVGEREVNGDNVTWRSRVTLEGNDGPVENNSASIVRDGLIVEHSAQRAEE